MYVKYAVEGNVYEPVNGPEPVKDQSINIIGKFNCILSNPPFVAVPFAKTGPVGAMIPARYSDVGTGEDGTMDILRKILKGCFQVLEYGTEPSVVGVHTYM